MSTYEWLNNLGELLNPYRNLIIINSKNFYVSGTVSFVERVDFTLPRSEYGECFRVPGILTG